MNNFERICGFDRLAFQEQLLYNALKYYDDECSVVSSWKHYGVLQNELNHMYFIDGLLSESEYSILDAYLFEVIYSDCYNNMRERMEVRVEDER